MTIYLNDKPVEVADSITLSAALESLSIPVTGIATAVNGAVIPNDKRGETTLNPGDKILIIKAFYGG